ncbi:tetratricopeptide repeat protein [Geomesophilobacter sediminis]|uniref:Tetratricopeptide repeat protein n=1 Tax=Geomesophilobacter sediminis TaxID=2798584 RepID=A0A8J7IWR6_9BACT|nr:tetratricopeptide repeat protein [Geomesophilobacter sediminis]MBJ6724052.1 tetratricopeptide repeat protein [Geomesophilobacter sediminis]
MGIFDKLFGRKSEETETVAEQPVAAAPAAEATDDGPMMKVFDAEGNEGLVPRAQWREVLMRNLENQVDDPEQLYNTLITALQEGFAADVLPFAEHLRKIDPIPTRSAVTLGIFYMETERLDEAEILFNEFTAQHGPHPIILANLAKLYSRQGDDERAESTLWNALEADPNNDNSINWYVAIQRHRAGDEGAVDAFRRIAGLPGSWKAQLALARAALEANDVAGAEALYQEAIDAVTKPAPVQLLLQVSADLGAAGLVDQMARLVTPNVDPAVHGLEVGNNIIKANLEQGRLGEARAMLESLQALNRSEWHTTLRFWNVELIRAEEATSARG